METIGPQLIHLVQLSLQKNNAKKVLSFLALFFSVLAVYFALYASMFASSEKSAVNAIRERKVSQTRNIMPPASLYTSTTSSFESVPFYRTIIDNNLFRPLGWRPPRPKEPYRLIGTILPKNADVSPNAILQTTAGNKTYIVSTGDKLDTDTTVTDIQPKQVTLEKAGQQRPLTLNPGPWLK